MKLVFSFLFLSLFAFQVNAQPAQRRTAKEKKQEVKSTPKKAATEAKAEAKPETKPEVKQRHHYPCTVVIPYINADEGRCSMASRHIS